MSNTEDQGAKKTILVTGASGFIGRRFVDRMCDRHKLFATDRWMPSEPDHRVQWLSCDFGEPSDLEKFPRRIDAIVHLAVSLQHRDFPDSALEQFAVNMGSTATLLDYAYRSGAQSFIMMSTGSVYDATSEKLMHEEDAVSPKDFFAATKVASEYLMVPYSEHFSTCALRLFFPYGPGQRGRLIPDLIDRVSHGKPIQLRGTSEGMRLSPIHVDDVVNVLEASILGQWQGVYNLGGRELLGLRSLALEIGNALGKEPVFEEVPGPDLRFQPDLTRLNSKVDISAFRVFAEAIREAIAVD